LTVILFCDVMDAGTVTLTVTKTGLRALRKPSGPTAGRAREARAVLVKASDGRRVVIALGLVANLTSGTSFTPLVGGDVNGDGLANDRAFFFDPRSAADPVVAQGMDRVLAAAPSGVRRCLRAQAGRVADHNSCRTRWSHSLDLNARLQP
jgi:hypothetical protein